MIAFLSFMLWCAAAGIMIWSEWQLLNMARDWVLARYRRKHGIPDEESEP